MEAPFVMDFWGEMWGRMGGRGKEWTLGDFAMIRKIKDLCRVCKRFAWSRGAGGLPPCAKHPPFMMNGWRGRMGADGGGWGRAPKPGGRRWMANCER